MISLYMYLMLKHNMTELCEIRVKMREEKGEKKMNDGDKLEKFTFHHS